MRDERGRCTTLGCTSPCASPCAKTKPLFKGNGEFWNLNLLRYFHKTNPQVPQRRKKKSFPMGTHVHEQGHGAERSGAERSGHGGQLDARTPPHRRHNASRAHTQLRSLARTNETKRFPGWSHPPTSDIYVHISPSHYSLRENCSHR